MSRKCILLYSDSSSRRGLLFLMLGISILLFREDYVALAEDYGATDATELEALFAVLSSINSGTNWRDELSDPCNSWQQGIYCMPDNDTGELHVTNLEFGTLSENIDIIPCSSHASLHPSVAKLPYLQSLQIFGCFTNQSTVLPNEIGMLGDLQILTLQDNPALVGTLPSVVGDLTSLQRLSVTECGVEGIIPSELGNLVSLQQLDLSRNHLEGPIPASLNSLVALQIMDLGDNFLSGVLPAMSGLTSLVKMVLSKNFLNGSIPSDLGQLTSLTYLDLSYNNFTGGIPPSFADLKNLEDLFVGHNSMGTPLPGFFGSMPLLSRLSLAQSNYVGVIPHEYGNMTNLRVLLLTGNWLSGSIPPELGSLPHIYHLDLSRNNLTGPVPFSLDFVEKMGLNLLFTNNSGLCFPLSTQRVAVATTGLNTCTFEGPESSNLAIEAAEAPLGEANSPLHSSDAPFTGGIFLVFFSVAICCLLGFFSDVRMD